MKDPLLLTYAIRESLISPQGPFLFDISSRLQPISIRDQMFRGHAIVNRTLSAGIIQKGQTDPILVIGGGVAGLMAAMTAMQNSVPVVLVEKQSLFATQAPSGRIICATEYDWPAPHWNSGTYPSNPSSTPFHLKTMLAIDLLMIWESQLKKWDKNYPDALDMKIGTKFIDYHVVGGAVRVDLDPSDTSLPLFKTVISCAGFGSERTSIPDDPPKYRGFYFWERDPFEYKNMGLKPDEKPNVIICGGGDGALQDFLRITTKKAAGEIYKLLPNAVKQTVEERIFRAEDRALRGFVWGSSGVLDCPIHRPLHYEHQDVVDSLFNDGRSLRSIRKSLYSLTKDLNKRLSIKLAYSCDHFSNCYSLNRFLVLLISKYLSFEFDMDVLLPGVKIHDIESVGHQCLGNPFLCHGKFHNLIGADTSCLNFNDDPQQLKTIAGGPFNIVIVRHGIIAGDPPLRHAPAALPNRQIIPYDIPS